jgi:hypothetical protein
MLYFQPESKSKSTGYQHPSSGSGLCAPLFQRLGHEDGDFKVSMGYRARACPPKKNSLLLSLCFLSLGLLWFGGPAHAHAHINKGHLLDSSYQPRLNFIRNTLTDTPTWCLRKYWGGPVKLTHKVIPLPVPVCKGIKDPHKCVDYFSSHLYHLQLSPNV